MKLHKQGWEETENCRKKNAITEGHQGEKKNNSIMLYQQVYIFYKIMK